MIDIKKLCDTVKLKYTEELDSTFTSYWTEMDELFAHLPPFDSHKTPSPGIITPLAEHGLSAAPDATASALDSTKIDGHYFRSNRSISE